MGMHVKERIKYWAQIILLPLYGFSFLFPRNKKIWLFGSSFGKRFSENPRYFYLYTIQNKKDKVRPVWISHSKEIIALLDQNGYEAYYYHSLKGIFLSLRAGVYIFDNYSKDISFWLSGGAVKINLWHGSGNKKTNYDNEFDQVRHPLNIWQKWKTWLRRLSDEKPNHYTLATSEPMADIFTSAFATDRNHIILEGYPRNDMLFADYRNNILNILTDKEKHLLKLLTDYKNQGFTLIAYIPTFRDSEKVFFDVMDLQVFNNYLSSGKKLFITKLHPKSKMKKKFEEINYSNVINADMEVDIYSFLQKIDILITDYSSVYTDYMLLERPVVAFHYDWDLYTANTRDCYIPQDDYMPEVKAITMEELIGAIDLVLEKDICLDKRLLSRKRMFANVDGNSCKRLFDKVYAITVY